MFGFVLIVLVITTAFLFYVGAMLSREGGRAPPPGGDALATSFLSSIIKTTVSCGDRDYPVSELLRQVALSQERCPATRALTVFFQGVLDETFNDWGLNYNLRFLLKSKDRLDPLDLPVFTNEEIPEEERCSAATGYVTETVLIPILKGAGGVEVRLERC